MDPSILNQGSENTEEAAQKAQKAAQEEQIKHEILATVLDQEARERRMSRTTKIIPF